MQHPSETTTSRVSRSLKRFFRFRISSILALTGIVAVSICVYRGQFNPQLTCMGLETNFDNYVLDAGEKPKISVLRVTNRGCMPIWYQGYDEICNVQINYETLADGSYGAGWSSSSKKTWSALWPGQSVRLDFPTPEFPKNGHVGFLLMDWRGRKGTYWSESFVFEANEKRLPGEWTLIADYWLDILW